MRSVFRLFKRHSVFYWQDARTGTQRSFRTTDKGEGQRLLAAKNEAIRNPLLNLALAKIYLSAQDARLTERTWSDVMAEISKHGRESTQNRCQRAVRSRSFDRIRKKKLVETTGDDLLAVLAGGGPATNVYLRVLNNFALGIGWLPAPVLHPKLWPKILIKPKRAITADEHRRIIAAEKNAERRLYYELLWEIGASQSDAAQLGNQNIDWQRRAVIYHRQKLPPGSPPARLAIGARLEGILKQLPSAGPLFPKLITTRAVDRASEFRRRCKTVGISGISLHSYRYAWAQRALALGIPERWARLALGHASAAVHDAYARGADLLCPALDTFVRAQNNVPGSAVPAPDCEAGDR